jgi:hypothetical protein
VDVDDGGGDGLSSADLSSPCAKSFCSDQIILAEEGLVLTTRTKTRFGLPLRPTIQRHVACTRHDGRLR